jgi:hypothetical protein
MKRMGKVLFGMFFMIFLFTLSHAAEIHSVVPSKKVKIAWDATTTSTSGKPISNPNVVGYFVYICEDVDKKCEKSDPQNQRQINEIPIPETKYELPFLEEGQYFVGVKAVLYEDKNMNGKPVEESSISWSCSGACTNNNPFCIRIGQ